MLKNKPVGRWATVFLVFLPVFLVGLLGIAYFIYSNEFRMDAWLRFIHHVDVLGIFSHSSDEDLDDAVFLSIGFFYAPVAALLTKFVLMR